MLKLLVGYPSKSDEKEIVRRVGFEEPAEVSPVLERGDINEIRALINEIYMDEKILDYIVNIVTATRNPAEYKIDIADYIQFGASPRASIYLSLAARAYAFLQGRGYATPQDVKTIAPEVLRHRVLLTYEAEAEDVSTDGVIQKIFDSVEVP
jgi:MoxR-like ATPase